MDGDLLSEDQIALVIRRASELDGQLVAGPTGLDLGRLEEAAVEAGLSRESVRRAVAELRAGALAGPEDRRRAAGRGRGRLTVGRTVPGPAADVDGLVRRFLTDELFRVRRDLGNRCLWGRRQDVRARVRLSVDRTVHRQLALCDVDTVEAAIVEEPGSEGRAVLVNLQVDLRPLRRVYRVAMGKGAAVAIAATTVVLAVAGAHPEGVVAVPAVLGTGVVAGHALGQSRFRSRVDELETALEGFLDRVQRRGRS